MNGWVSRKKGKSMKERRMQWMRGIIMVGLACAPTYGLVTMTVTPVNQIVNAGDVLTFDIIVESDEGNALRSYQCVLPCMAAPQPGASGSINHLTIPPTMCTGDPSDMSCNFVGFSTPCNSVACVTINPGACGGIPANCIPVSGIIGVCLNAGTCRAPSPTVDQSRPDFVFPPPLQSNVGLDVGTCPVGNPRLANSLPAGSSFLLLPGDPRYMGTFKHRVAAGSFGNFLMSLVGVNNPPTDLDDTRMRDVNGVLIAFTPVSATIQVRQCMQNSDCNDGLFCNGVETCVANFCQPGTNPCTNPLLPLCDENLDQCVECLNDGQCSDGVFCNGMELCVAGQCQDAPNLSAGTPCGDGSDTDCTNPDTCNGFGTCSPNHAPNGTGCEDGLFCTVGSTCSNGSCMGGGPRNCSDGVPCTSDSCNEGTNMCDNVIDPGFCLINNLCRAAGATNPGNDCEQCDPAQSTSMFTPKPDGTMCADEGNDCTGDTCQSGICSHDNHPAGTPCDDGDPCTGTGDKGVGIDECDGMGMCSGMPDPDCNDNCENAVVAMGGVNTGSNVTATGMDSAEASCQANSNHDVWFKFTAPCDGNLLITTTGSLFAPQNDTVLSVYDSCGGMELACNDDGGPGALSALTISVTTGTMYFIRVAGFGANVGSIVLNINPDDFCLIDGVCYANGAVNPGNECQFCDTSNSTTSWSPQQKGTVCGDQSSSECDNPDACDGLGFCEPDNKPDGTQCSDEGNDCTENVCMSGVCIHPNLPVDTMCGSQVDSECDNPDTCNGLGLCLDNFEQPGQGCGDSNDDDCDNPDTCDGFGGCIDNLEPDGTMCTDDGNDCKADVCQAGACAHPNEPGGTFCGNPQDTLCDNPDTCNGGGVCLENFEMDGTPCDDFDDCTEDELCVSGECIGVAIPEAPIVVAVGQRRISITPQPPGSTAPVALRLTSPFYPCLVKYVQLDGTLGDTPVFQLPDDWGKIVSFGSEYVPLTPYAVQAECGAFLSDFGSDTTWIWGDVNNDGAVDVLDIVLVLDGFAGIIQPGIDPANLDLAPCDPDQHIDVSDIGTILDAFGELPFPCPGPC